MSKLIRLASQIAEAQPIARLGTPLDSMNAVEINNQTISNLVSVGCASSPPPPLQGRVQFSPAAPQGCLICFWSACFPCAAESSFNFEGGEDGESPEYVFGIRLVINDHPGLYIYAMKCQSEIWHCSSKVWHSQRRSQNIALCRLRLIAPIHQLCRFPNSTFCFPLAREFC